jgi:hypothetical protein
MKTVLVLLCGATIGLGIANDGQAQVLRRRSGCGVSSGCNVGSSGCSVGASRGCNISPAVPASVVVPAQLPATFVPSAVSAPVGGQAVERLFEQAAGCASGSCPIEKPAPSPSDSTRVSVDARSAMAFCALPGPEAAEFSTNTDLRWSGLVAAFR